MQMNRLFEIVYLLMERGDMTASELSQRLEVSVRTIYRDVDTLSGAGIPIYASKGKGGGIRLLDDFVLHKSLLSDEEQNDILASLQGLSAISVPDADTVLTKLSALFGKNRTSWLDVDFSRWGGGSEERNKFNCLKNAILQNTVITFEYYSAGSEQSVRTVEPVKLLFKGQSWYLSGFCRTKNDFRIFKTSRIKNLIATEEHFNRIIPEVVLGETKQPHRGRMIKLKLKIDASMAYRVYDEIPKECIVKLDDGSFCASIDFPENEWIYGFILSFGSKLEVLEPAEVREETARLLEKTLKRYR